MSTIEITDDVAYRIPVISHGSEDNTNDCEPPDQQSQSNQSKNKDDKEDHDSDTPPPQVNEIENPTESVLPDPHIRVRSREWDNGKLEIKIEKKNTEKDFVEHYPFRLTDEYTRQCAYNGNESELPIEIKQALYAAGFVLESKYGWTDKKIAALKQLNAALAELDSTLEDNEGNIIFWREIATNIAGLDATYTLAAIDALCDSTKEKEKIAKTYQDKYGSPSPDSVKFLNSKVEDLDEENHLTEHKNRIMVPFMCHLPEDKQLINIVTRNNVGHYIISKAGNSSYTIQNNIDYISPSIQRGLQTENINIENVDDISEYNTPEELMYFIHTLIEEITPINFITDEGILSNEQRLILSAYHLIPYSIDKEEYTQSCAKAKKIFKTSEKFAEYNSLEELQGKTAIVEKLILKTLPEHIRKESVRRILDFIINDAQLDITAQDITGDEMMNISRNKPDEIPYESKERIVFYVANWLKVPE